jgi:hypothetical protein
LAKSQGAAWAAQYQILGGHMKTNANMLFTTAQVANIRQRVAAGESQAKLAREHDVSENCISKMVRFITYKHNPWRD